MAAESQDRVVDNRADFYTLYHSVQLRPSTIVRQLWTGRKPPGLFRRILSKLCSKKP